ncbi:DNA polymerase type-X family protein-like protein [Paramyrothecium foliicola]|nr:DNA polymerase type-X family protein-like protein [Paramyrothecium foliicola]
MALRLPSIYLLPTHLQPDELHELEERIPSLTYDIREAEVVVGKLSKRERAMFELRRAKLETEPWSAADEPPDHKRRRVSPPDEAAEVHDTGFGLDSSSLVRPRGTVKVVKLSWLTESLEQGRAMPLDAYLLYEGYKLPQSPELELRHKSKPPMGPPPADHKASAALILQRAAADTTASQSTAFRHPGSARSQLPARRPRLLHETTSEHDLPLPPIPEYLTTTYSCQRPTPVNPPNAPFIEQLKEVRTLRILEGDKIGVRAYSSSIAALAAYPYPLQGHHDVARLPGCGHKIAELYQQWIETGQLVETTEAANDSRLATLRLFYEIWGVGDTTAREFYKKGWRDLDDVVEYGWQNLSRVQQIGVKYYDEFKSKIPRPEVEKIASIVLDHSRKIDPGFQLVIVGGYRRGKAESGDVDLVISNPQEAATLHFVERLVMSLEKGKYITHTLIMSSKNSERGQMPVAWKGDGGAGTGFDTLDKALVVWQDPLQVGAPHRRVDLIISPWKTAGCAVLGWSGGTTFQRDVRRYCKKEMRLKFDSSGIRSRVDGSWVDLEGGAAEPAPDMVTAEKMVFEGLGLTYRRPDERCTG